MTVAEGETGDQTTRVLLFNVWQNVVSSQMLEVSLLEVGTVLSLERKSWSVVQRPRKKQQASTPPPLPVVSSEWF